MPPEVVDSMVEYPDNSIDFRQNPAARGWRAGTSLVICQVWRDELWADERLQERNWNENDRRLKREVVSYKWFYSRVT